MPRLLASCLGILVANTLWMNEADAQYHVWSRMFTDLQGGIAQPPAPPNLEAAKRSSGAVDASGNLVMFGRFSGTLDFGGGPITPNGGFLVKLDPSGAHLWSHRFAGNFYGPRKTHVACDPQGNVIAMDQAFDTDFGDGPVTGWPVVVKFGHGGNHLWTRVYRTDQQGSTNTGGFDLATDANGNVFVVGAYWGTVNFGDGTLPVYGGTDIFVVKLDPNGNTLWSRGYGTGFADNALSVACGPDGDIVVTGHTGGSSIQLGGPPVGVPSPYGCNFAVKYRSSNGSHLWSHAYFDRIGSNSWMDVATNAASEVILAGGYRDSIDLGGGTLRGTESNSFLAKLGAAGGHLWSRNFPASANAAISMTGVATDTDGMIHVVGFMRGIISVGGDPISVPSTLGGILAAGFDQQGQHQWSSGFGDNLQISGMFVDGPLVDGNANTAMVVEWHGSIDFGGESFSTPYDLELFLVKLGRVPTDVGRDAATTFLQAVPNPSRGLMVLSVPGRAHETRTVRILDPRGRLVRTLASAQWGAEMQVFDWDGLDDRGRPVGAGVYFATVTPMSGVAKQKLLIVR